MAFKNLEDYNEQKYSGKFVLQNDGDEADVVFLYRSTRDVLVADVHYIKSADYSGYVHCLGRGCPACSKSIRVQTKLFIPLYNLTNDEIQFWDRNVSFEPHIQKSLFRNGADPSNYVYTIRRHGEPRSRDTWYEMTPTKNNRTPYAEILNSFNIKMPDYYENICRSADSNLMSMWLSSPTDNGDSGALPDYVATPRVSASYTAVDAIPEMDDAERFSEDITEEVDFS